MYHILLADCVPEIENNRENSLIDYFSVFLMCPCKETIKLSFEINYNADKVSRFVDLTDLSEP